MESLTENRFNDIASSAMCQVHERCFSPSLSEFKQTKMRNGAMAHLKTVCGPQVGNHWSKQRFFNWLKISDLISHVLMSEKVYLVVFDAKFASYIKIEQPLATISCKRKSSVLNLNVLSSPERDRTTSPAHKSIVSERNQSEANVTFHFLCYSLELFQPPEILTSVFQFFSFSFRKTQNIKIVSDFLP